MTIRRWKKDILNGNIAQQLLLLIFPLFLGYLLQHFYGFVDNIILGRLISKEALAAVGGSASSLINIYLNFVGGITSAITVLVARSCGQGNMDKVNNSIRTGMFVSITIGAVLTAIMIPVSPYWLTLMHEPAETRSLSLTYLYIYFASIVFYFVYQTGISIFRAMGDSRRPLMMIGVTAASKILLDLLLAGVFKLGILGTSLATFLSHLICAVLVLYIFGKTDDIYYFSLKEFGYDKEDLKQIFMIGLPFAIQSMMFAIPNAVTQYKVNSFGTDAVAAYAAFGSIDGLFWCFSNAICTATITMTSQNFGSRNMKRVRKTLWTACLIELAGVFVYSTIFLLDGRQILRLFLKEENTLDIAQAMLTIIALSYPATIFVDIFSQIFKSCGLIRTPLLIAIFTVCGTRVAFILLYPITRPEQCVLTFTVSWIVTSCAYLVYYLCRKDVFRNDSK